MVSNFSKFLLFVLAFAVLASFFGVYASWVFCLPMDESDQVVGVTMGEFSYDPGEILYISAVEQYASDGFSEPLQYSHSLPTNLRTRGTVQSRGSSVTYKVTVFNNTDTTYWYIGQKHSGHGTNGLITEGGITVRTKEKPSDTTGTFNSYDWVPARTKRDFYVTYTFSSAAAVTAVDLLVNFYFSIRIDGVQDEFLRILNDKETANGYYYLSDAFNDVYAENGKNVVDSINNPEVFENLFGGDLMIDVDGKQVPVTVSVQRKNVDGTSNGDSYSGGGPTGCEYTVYVTTDPLESGGTATVYAISYSCGSDGVWYQIGQLYEGTAPMINSNGGPIMNVDRWVANPNNIQIGEGIEYKVGQQYGTSYDILKTVEQIMSTGDTEIFNKIDNSRLFKKVYDILNSSENKYSEAPEVVHLRHVFEICAPYYDIRNNGQEIKVVRNCTRAEILPYLVKLCDALEYYREVHG